MSMNLPKKLLNEATRLSGVKNKTAAVVLGLEELIKKKKIEKFLSLQGSKKVRYSKQLIKKFRER